MKDYIERVALLKQSETMFDGRRYCTAVNTSRIYTAPAADVVEVKHGFWRTTEAYPHWLCCSECNARFLPNIEWIERFYIPTKYCPNCGACMDGGKHNV